MTRIPRELLRDTVAVENYEGSGAMGPTFASSRSIRASAQGTGQLMTDERGRVVSSLSLLIIRPEDGPIPVESKVTIAGEVYRAVQCYPVPDTRRPSHYEVRVERYSAP